MDDHDIKLDPNEEYHYTETPETDIFEPSQPVRPHGVDAGAMLRKTILIFIGLVIAGLAFYKLYGIFRSSYLARKPTTFFTQPQMTTSRIKPVTITPTAVQQAPTPTVTTTQAPVRAVTTTQAPVRAVTTTQAPARAVTTTQAPARAVTTTQAPIQAVTTMQAPARAATTKQAPIQAVTTTQAPAQARTNISNQQLAALQSQSQQSQAQVSALQTQMNDLANSVSTVQASLTAINAQLQTITNTLQAQQAEIAALKPRPRPRPKRLVKVHPVVIVKAPPAPLGPVYYVRAMIPGRAWLAEPNGNTITVSLGDKLYSYGIITKMDPGRGAVFTSSGIVFRYQGN